MYNSTITLGDMNMVFSAIDWTMKQNKLDNQTKENKF